METFLNKSLTEKMKIMFNTNDSNKFINQSINEFNDNLKLLEILNKYSDYETEKFNRNATVIVFYSMIVFVSLFGNLLVCFVLIKNKTMRTKTNILMANITISGLMMTVFNIPFIIARIVLDNWPFGVILCKLVPSMQVTFV
jgi:hypothetical protein